MSVKVMSEGHKRKCWDCGNVAVHMKSITPEVLCTQCGSQDTRRVKGEKPSIKFKDVTFHSQGPYCPSCSGYLFGDTDPCCCIVHKPDTISESLRHVADTMRRMTAIMRDCGGFGNSERGKLLLQHAAEMQGAAEMCIDWADNLESK